MKIGRHLPYCWRLSLLAAAAVSAAYGQQGKLHARSGSVDQSPVLKYEYLLGAEDQLIIHLTPASEFPDEPVAIAPDGFIKLPLIGRVRAAGLTAQQLEDQLTAKLQTYFREPAVTVAVSEYRSQPVSVTGAVNKPGVIQVRGRHSLLEVISDAGGLLPDSGNYAVVTRKAEWGAIPLARSVSDDSGQYNIVRINVRELIVGKHPEENIEVKPFDVIAVTKAESVFVVGEVGKAGSFPLVDRDSVSVLQALAMAGGAGKLAALHDARILRTNDGGGPRAQLKIDLKEMLDGKVQDASLLPEDILYVPVSGSKRITERAIEAAIQLGTGVLIWRR